MIKSLAKENNLIRMFPIPISFTLSFEIGDSLIGSGGSLEPIIRCLVLFLITLQTEASLAELVSPFLLLLLMFAKNLIK